MDLENGYEIGLFSAGELPEEYQGAFDSHEDFDEKAGILKYASSFEETAEMMLNATDQDSMTLGKMPIEGPIGASLVENVDLNYSIEFEDGEVRDYWEIDTEIVDTENRETRENVRALESVVKEHATAEVKETDIESVSNALEAAEKRVPT